MRTSVLFFVLAFGLGLSSYQKAVQSGAEAKIVLEVKDECGVPVADAFVLGYMTSGDVWRPENEFHGRTDLEGKFAIVGKTTGRIGFCVQKEGYYETKVDAFDVNEPKDGASPDSLIQDGRWVPFGCGKLVVLKRFHNPSSKRSKMGQSVKVPAYGVWLSFDLQRLQWCKPYGDGEFSDVLLRFTQDRPWRSGDSYSSSMEMSFTNQPFAGAYVLKRDGSSFDSCYKASTEDVYLKRYFKFEHVRNEFGLVKDEFFPSDSYIVFRTRTKTDAKGRLKSAHYGKMYGEWRYGKFFRFGRVLFGDEPNDVNLEEVECANRSRASLEFVEGMRWR